MKLIAVFQLIIPAVKMDAFAWHQATNKNNLSPPLPKETGVQTAKSGQKSAEAGKEVASPDDLLRTLLRDFIDRRRSKHFIVGEGQRLSEACAACWEMY